MTLPEKFPDEFLSPTETVKYLRTRYRIQISLPSLYSMISRGDAPKGTYFRNRPKFTEADIDEWVKQNLSDNRK
jgi:predicted DNA-binding transcriptional regulator AlpA